jgi:hypothetical protein
MLQFPWLLNGVVIVETLFNYKGFGWLLVQAASNNDIELLLAVGQVTLARNPKATIDNVLLVNDGFSHSGLERLDLHLRGHSTASNLGELTDTNAN